LSFIKDTVAALVPGLVASKAELDTQLATLRETPLVPAPEVQPNVETPPTPLEDDKKTSATVKSGDDEDKTDRMSSVSVMVVTPPLETDAFLARSGSPSTRPLKTTAKRSKH
jgi:hypothetical protein